MHRWSKLFIPTLREAPADAEVASHQLLLRAGYVRQLGAGIYSYLPLGTRSINKIIAIVREEMDVIAQEFFLPALLPREPWDESGRWTGMGDNMFRLKDRKGADLCLGMTHEEIMTSIARNEVRSYKQLPQIWYQIQTKFRDEPRPKSGLLRVRQFTMKDSYSFDIDEAGLDESYQKHDEAYRRIFTRCGLEFVAVEADSGAMGGSQSQEFMVYTEAGEDWIASSPDGTYAANIEKATSKLAPVADLETLGDAPKMFATPKRHSINEVVQFILETRPFLLGGIGVPGQLSATVKAEHLMKTMAYFAFYEGEKGIVAIPIVALVRGDHEVNETKLLAVSGAKELQIAKVEQVERYFKCSPGSLGPINVQAVPTSDMDFLAAKGILPKALVGAEAQNVVATTEAGVGIRRYSELAVVIMDAALHERKNLISGANINDAHLYNVTPYRDFVPSVTADIRNVSSGEPDPVSGRPLRLGKAVEIGHIFKLGYKYSQSMGARVLDRNGKETTPIMGSYGIGIERILTSAMEQSAAKLGKNDRGEWSYVLPAAIAPYEVVVTVTKQSDTALADAGERIALELEQAGFDVLLDDRDGSAGVKFKDADLIGVPYRVTVGKRLVEGFVEVVDRLQGKTEEVAVAEVGNVLRKLRQALSASDR